MSKKDITKKLNLFNIFFLNLLKKKKYTKSISKISMKNSIEWDSINQLNIIFKIETIFKLKVKNSDIKKLNSYSKIVKYVKKNIR
tara:strand:- start:361 stop:615 length:255 start_codon:yes stop_codon:yes gene_type:complete